MLKMGCAKIDVTPDFPVFLRGYGARKQKTALVEEPIEVGVIALEQDGKKVLMITADNLGIQVEDCRKITARIQEEFGIGGADVMISCSHTHFAPVSGRRTRTGHLPAGHRIFQLLERQTPHRGARGARRSGRGVARLCGDPGFRHRVQPPHGQKVRRTRENQLHAAEESRRFQFLADRRNVLRLALPQGQPSQRDPGPLQLSSRHRRRGILRDLGGLSGLFQAVRAERKARTKE